MQATDLQVFRALANGRCSSNRVNSGVVSNVFPAVKTAERAAGRILYEKLFWALMNIDNKPLLDPAPYIDKPSASTHEYIVMQLVGQRDTVSAVEAGWAAGKCYGTAVLKNDVAAGATELVVTVKGAGMLPGGDDEIFRASEILRLCSHTSAVTGDGSEEDVAIHATNAITYSGMDITIPLSTAVVGSYSAGQRVSTIIPLADIGTEIKPTVASIAVTNAKTVDSAGSPIQLDNIGTPEEDITILFTSATAFDCTGDTLGSLGSGTVSADFSPVDSVSGRPRFTIPAAFWNDTYAAGDQVTFTLHPARIPVGEKQVVLAGAPALSNNSTALILAGEVA